MAMKNNKDLLKAIDGFEARARKTDEKLKKLRDLFIEADDFFSQMLPNYQSDNPIKKVIEILGTIKDEPSKVNGDE